MINPARLKQVRKSLLSALAMAGNYAVPVETLWGFVNDLVKPPLTFGEKGGILQWAVKCEYIREVPDSLDEGLKQYVLTELGRNFLASL